MKLMKAKLLFVSLLTIMAVLQSAAMAGELKPGYKKVSGRVVSANPTSIVIKGRAKEPLTLAVTAKTKVIGAKAAKAGDRATVNYRADKNGKTATKIKIMASAEKPASAPEQQAASGQKSN